MNDVRRTWWIFPCALALLTSCLSSRTVTSTSPSPRALSTTFPPQLVEPLRRYKPEFEGLLARVEQCPTLDMERCGPSSFRELFEDVELELSSYLLGAHLDRRETAEHLSSISGLMEGEERLSDTFVRFMDTCSAADWLTETCGSLHHDLRVRFKQYVESIPDV